MDSETFLQLAIHVGFIEYYGPGQCVKSHQPKRLFSDAGNKSVFERNQNNINPMRCVAAGSVLIGRKTGRPPHKRTQRRKCYFPFHAYSTSRGKQISIKNLLSGSNQQNRWSVQILYMIFPQHVAKQCNVATVQLQNFLKNIHNYPELKRYGCNDFIAITMWILVESIFPKEYISRNSRVVKHHEQKLQFTFVENLIVQLFRVAHKGFIGMRVKLFLAVYNTGKEKGRFILGE